MYARIPSRRRMALFPHPLRAYARHLLRAGDRHDVHSPFIFDLVNEVLRKHTPRDRFADIEAVRRSLLRDARELHITDHGAGPKRGATGTRAVRTIAATALKPRRQAAMLARMVGHYHPRTVLELGTSLGLTTLYLARAAPDAAVHSIEGCPETAAIAQALFKERAPGRITSVVGPFSERLPGVLDTMERLDFAFIDGHHAMEPTLMYLEQCLTKAHNDTVFVLDDIHWSTGMERAWEAIKAHPRVTVTVDLFHFGIVFLRKEQQREDFILRY